MFVRVYYVEGMTTEKCKEKIEQYVAKLNHVNRVEADINTKKICVTAEKIVDYKLDKLLNGLGYTIKTKLP